MNSPDNPMTATASRSSAYVARRKARGDRKVQVWLPRAYVARWDALVQRHGGAEVALVCAIGVLERIDADLAGFTG